MGRSKSSRKKSRRGATPATDPGAAAGTAAPTRYRAGLVIVHGIGHQSPGQTLDHASRRVKATLSEMGHAAGVCDQRRTPGSPLSQVVDVDGRHSALLVEAHWADIVADHRERGLLAALRRLWFLISTLPYLLPALLAPRFHESEVPPRPVPVPRRRLFAGIQSETEDFIRLAPTMSRSITLYAFLAAIAIGFSSLPLWLAISLCATAILLVIVLLASSRDVTEHVYVATLSDHRREEILQRVATSIDFAAQQCDEVWVMGHSQGGYLAHTLLAERGRHWRNVRRFTGVASGLRPIHLISMLRDPLWALAGWVWLGGIVLFSIGVIQMLEPGGPLNTDASRAIGVIGLFVLVAPALLFSLPVDLMTELSSGLIPTNWWFLLYIGLGLATALIAVLLQKLSGVEMTTIPELPPQITWEEMSARGDVVGSMSVPELPPSAIPMTIPSVNNPLVDHLLSSYLGARSVLRFDISAWLARRKSPPVDGLRRSLAALSESNYVFRISTQIVFVMMFVAFPVVMGLPLLVVVANVLVTGIATAAITGIWTMNRWRNGATKRIKAFTTSATEGRKDVLYPQTFRRHRRSLVMSLSAAAVSGIGGFGMTIVAATGELGAPDRLAVLTEHLRGGGTYLILAGLAATVALCTGIAGTRGVRAWLTVALVLSSFSLLVVLSSGSEWAIRLFPGVHLPIISAVLVTTALAWSRRLPTHA